MRQTFPELPTVLLSYEQLLETLHRIVQQPILMVSRKKSALRLTAIHSRPIEVGIFLLIQDKCPVNVYRKPYTAF